MIRFFVATIFFCKRLFLSIHYLKVPKEIVFSDQVNMAQINLGVEVTNMSSPLFKTIILLVRFLREVFDTSKKMQF